jgi:hypothetical protein
MSSMNLKEQRPVSPHAVGALPGVFYIVRVLQDVEKLSFLG